MLATILGAGLRLLLAVVSGYISYRAFQLHRSFRTNTVVAVMWIYIFTMVMACIQAAAFIGGVDYAANVLGIFDGITGVVTAYLFVLFTSMYEEVPNTILRIIISTAFSTLTVVALLSTVDVINGQTTQSLFTLIFVPYFFYSVILIVRSLRRMSKYMIGKQLDVVKYIKVYLYLGVIAITMYYAFVTVYFGYINPNPPATINSIFFYANFTVPSLLFILSSWIFYYGYIRPRNPALLQPQRIRKFILSHPTGVPFFEYDFGDYGHIDNVLIAGAIAAIEGLLKEAANIDGDLEQIKLGGQFIIVKSNLKGIGTLFSEVDTPFLHDALQQVMDSITSLPMATHIRTKEEDRVLTEIVERCFGRR